MTKLLKHPKNSIGIKCWRCCFKTVLVLTCFLVFLSPILSPFRASAQSRTSVETEIILQGFNWESALRPGGGWYNVVTSLSQEIKVAGFTSVWLPPPSEAVPSPDQPPVPGVVDSRGYLPLRYYNLNSMYGSVFELRNLLASLRSHGVSPIADIVINHRAAMNRDNYGRWNVFEAPVWGTWAIVREHVELGATGGPDSGVVYPFAADLDHANGTVRRDLTDWMLWLKNEVGFTGWRYDFSKGYSGTFVAEYNTATTPNFSVGEYWTELDYSCTGEIACYNQDSHRQRIVDWIDSTWKNSGRGPEFASAAFDFTTKGILQYAIRNGEFWRLRDSQSRPPGLIGLWPAKSVTFIDNHDTGSTQRHWVFGDFDQVRQGYAYILTHPGIPTVFWDHYFDWGMKQDINAMMAIRRRNGISATSSLVIEAAEKGLYAATIDGRVAVKIGSGDWSPVRTQRAPWRLTYSGNNFAVWEH